MPGVVAVLTGPELTGFDPYWGHAIKDRPILAIDRVRFRGEPVAAVAAEDEATAEAALREIVVDYDELPVLGTIAAATADDAPLCTRASCGRGSFTGSASCRPARATSATATGSTPARSSSPRRRGLTVEGEYEFPAVYQYAMETHTVIADFGDGEITLWASCQHPFLVRAEIADLFNLPIGRVRVIVPYLGGGFGSKSYTKMEPITAALSWKAGRPVRIQNSVEESMVTTRRHGMRCRMRTTADRDGKLLSRSVRLWLDTGAYADNGPRVCATAGDAAPGPYRWEAVHVDASCVYTNTSPAGSYRAFGAAHLQWIGELQVDEIARRAASTRSRSGAGICCGRASRRVPTAAASRSMPTWSVTSRRPQRRSAGASRRAIGSGAGSRSGCWPPARTRSRAPTSASRPTAASRSTSGPPRWARERAR